MTRRWRWWKMGSRAAQLAVEQAFDALAQAHRQTIDVERAAARAHAVAVHTDWFTRDMERALLRRRSE